MCETDELSSARQRLAGQQVTMGMAQEEVSIMRSELGCADRHTREYDQAYAEMVQTSRQSYEGVVRYRRTCLSTETAAAEAMQGAQRLNRQGERRNAEVLAHPRQIEATIRVNSMHSMSA